MNNFLLIGAVLLLALFAYWPIMKIAGRDIAERSAAGQSNAVVYAILLLPLLGPFIYLLARKYIRS